MFSVIVPTYNERDNMRALLERVLPVLDRLDEDAELLIVDDDSPDGTAEAVRSLASELGAAERVHAIVRTADRGLAKAVMEGFRRARGDVVAVMDADLSHPPEVLPDLLAPIRAGEAEITVGSRRVRGGGIANWPWTRRFTSWSAALMARPLVSVLDTTSGYFAVKKDLLDEVELRPIGYKIALEVLVRTDSRSVREVPFVFTDRTAGKSKLGGAVMIAYLQQLAGLYKLKIFGRPGAPGTPWRRRALLLVWAVAVLHLLGAGFIDLAADEAYYWQWARHPAAGYYDHPPMVAWLIAAGTAVFGSNEFGVRALFAVLLAALGWLVFRLTTALVRTGRDAGDPSPECAGFWAAAALLAMPLISVNGFLASPDVPLLFFWAATLALTLSAVRTRRLGTWIATGVVLGCAGLSKYHAILLPVALLAGLLLSKSGRRILRTPGPYVAVLVCGVMLLPYARWLLDHDFGGIKFQLEHGTDRSAWSTPHSALSTFSEFVGGQVLFVTPILFAFALYAIARSRRFDATARPVLVLCALVPLLLFAYASLKASPEANWPSVAYVSACILLGPLFARWQQGDLHGKFRVYLAVGLAAAASAYVHLEIVYPLFMKVGFVDKLEPREAFGRWAHEARLDKAGAGLAAPVLADNYRTASVLAFYLPDRPRTGAPFEFGSGEQYAYWEAETPLVKGARAWFVTRAVNDPRLAMLFSDYEEVSSFAGVRLGEVKRAYRAYWGVLRGEPIPRKPLW